MPPAVRAPAGRMVHHGAGGAFQTREPTSRWGACPWPPGCRDLQDPRCARAHGCPRPPAGEVCGSSSLSRPRGARLRAMPGAIPASGRRGCRWAPGSRDLGKPGCRREVACRDLGAVRSPVGTWRSRTRGARLQARSRVPGPRGGEVAGCHPAVVTSKSPGAGVNMPARTPGGRGCRCAPGSPDLTEPGCARETGGADLLAAGHPPERPLTGERKRTGKSKHPGDLKESRPVGCYGRLTESLTVWTAETGKGEAGRSTGIFTQPALAAGSDTRRSVAREPRRKGGPLCLPD